MDNKTSFREIFFETIRTVYKSAIPILLFEFFFNIITIVLLKPALNGSFNIMVKLSGYPVLLNSYIRDFLMSFMGILTVIIFINIFVLIVYYEFAVLLVILNKAYNKEKVSLRDSLVIAYLTLEKTIKKNNIGLAFYVLLLIPLVDFGLHSTLFPQINIPAFITGEIMKYPGGNIAIFLVGALIAIIYAKLFLVLPIMIVEEKNFKDATNKSLKIMKGKALRIGFFAFIILLIWTLFAILPVTLIDEIIGYNYQILNYLSIISTTILIVLISPMMLSVMLAVYKPNEEVEKSQEVLLIEELNLATLDHRIEIFKNKILFKLKKILNKIKKRPLWLIPIALGAFIIVYVNLPIGIIYDFKDTTVIGHRGGLKGVENTIEAILNGKEDGAEYAEIDILLSKDGIPMVIHDSKLSRLAGQNKQVGELTAEELKKIDLKDRGFKGKISTLEEVMIETQGKIKLLIEFKTHGKEEKSIVSEGLKIVEKYDREHINIFHTGEMELFEEFKAKNNDYKIGYIIIGKLGQLGKGHIKSLNADFLVFEESIVNQSLVNTCHLLNIPVFAWTINDRDVAEELIDMRVDGIISDHPKMIYEIREEYKNSSILEKIN